MAELFVNLVFNQAMITVAITEHVKMNHQEILQLLFLVIIIMKTIIAVTQSSQVQGAMDKIGKAISKRVAHYFDKIYYAKNCGSKRRELHGRTRVKSAPSVYHIKGGNIG